MPFIKRFIMIGLLIQVGVLSLCVPRAGAVIPNADNPEAYTEKKYRLDLLAYNKRTMSEAYKQVGQRDPAWDAIVIELLDAQAEFFTNDSVKPKLRVPSTYTEDRLQELIAASRESGCTDPLAQYVWLVYMDEDDADYAEFARQVYDGMLASGYSVNRKIGAAARLIRYLEDTEDKEQLKEAEHAWADLVVSAINDPDLSIETQHFMIRTFEDEFEDNDWIERWAEVVGRIDVETAANPWMAHLVCGYHHVELAWQARGKGWARTVTDEGWRGFREHLVLAQAYLVKAWELQPQYPHAAYEMIKVSMGLNSGQERVWFNRAVMAQFDYYRAYSSYLWSIRPRWGGSFDQIHAFATECLETGRYDTRVPSVFYDAMHDIADDADSFYYWQRDGIYEQFLKHFESMKHEPVPESDLQWWDSMKAAVAWRVGRYDDSARMMRELGDDLVTRAFLKFDGDTDLAPSEAYARAAVPYEVFDAARDDWLDHRYRSASERFDQALAGLPADDPARLYLRHLTVWAKRLHKQEQGTWIDLLGEPDLAGWIVRQGDWSADAQGRITGTSNRWGMKLECRFNFGYRAEIKGTISFLDNPGPEDYTAGVLSAFRVIDKKHYQRSVLLVPGTSEAESAQNYGWRQRFPARVTPTTQFHIQMWDEYVRLIVNDEVIYEGLKMRQDLPSKPYPIAIGGRTDAAGASVRYDELKVRRLDERPQWAEDPPDELAMGPLRN